MMMYPTKIQQWFVQYGVDPLIGWEVVEIALDNEYLIPNEGVLLDHCHTYLMTMLEAVSDEPDLKNLQYFLKHLIPMMRALAPYFTTDQINDLMADRDTPMMIASCVRVTLSVI